MKNLTAKEEEIMKILWDSGEMTPRQVLEQFEEPRPHFNTVATFLRILHQKGWVNRHPIPGTHLYTYSAAMTENEVGKKTVRSAISRFFHGSVTGMVSSLIDDNELTDSELEEIIELVRNKKQK